MKKQSEYLGKYRQFMGNAVQLGTPSPELLKKYSVEILDQKHQRPSKHILIRLEMVREQASIATYIVDIGLYRLTISLLNLTGLVSYATDLEMGRGAFGVVLSKKVSGT